MIQAGTAGELAAAPASAFVADFTGATVLTGEAAPGADGLTRVALDGGGSVASIEPGQGRVAVSVYPWEVALDAPERCRPARRRTTSRPRSSPSPRSATASASGWPRRSRWWPRSRGPSARELALEPGARVVATWKAAATRVLPL